MPEMIADARAPSRMLLTVGHGTLPADDFAALLGTAGVDHLVDVRSFPGSRRHPHFGREEMERWVPASGVDYCWAPDLGGRRRPVPGSPHVTLRNESFRAYADHMSTPAFRAAVDELTSVAARQRVAVMCSESVWWRCHRRLLADHLTLAAGCHVVHLMHDGRTIDHPLTEGVRPADAGVVYDGSSPGLPLG
jgi:uncharacterized protein (DUF488 family)